MIRALGMLGPQEVWPALDPPTPCPDSSMKISHTSPDIPLSTQTGDRDNCAHGIRVQRQVTEPTSSARSVLPPSFLDARQALSCFLDRKSVV